MYLYIYIYIYTLNNKLVFYYFNKLQCVNDVTSAIIQCLNIVYYNYFYSK